MHAPPWLGSPERLEGIGGWPEVAGGMVLGPFRDLETGDSIVKLEVVYPPDPDATVLFAEAGQTALVTLRLSGVTGISGFKSEVYNHVIDKLIVGPTTGPDGAELITVEILNPYGERLLLIEATAVSVKAVEVPAQYPLGPT